MIQKKSNIPYLSLNLHKGRPSYRRSLQPAKNSIRHIKTIPYISSLFCHFGSPGSGSDPRIQIQPPKTNTVKTIHFFTISMFFFFVHPYMDADPDPASKNQSGSGSTTPASNLPPRHSFHSRYVQSFLSLSKSFVSVYSRLRLAS